MLAGAIVIGTGIAMMLRLSNLSRTSIEAGEMLQKRRRITIPSLAIIGAAAALWVILFAFYSWWFVESSSHQWSMLFEPGRAREAAPR